MTPGMVFLRMLVATGLVLLAVIGDARAEDDGKREVVVGSKKFTESVILGEVLLQTAAHAGAKVRHQQELGGTRILWQALLAGEVDAYTDYTGTIGREILGLETSPDLARLTDILRQRYDVGIAARFGFANTYAMGVPRKVAAERGLTSVSDLVRHPDLVAGFSNAFMNRLDGWPGLREAYGLPQVPTGLDHDLAYQGIAQGKIDITDVYTTDAEIPFYDLVVLVDDKGYFPNYDAVILYRLDLADREPAVVAAWAGLADSIDEPRMQALNRAVKIERRGEWEVAAAFLAETQGIEAQAQQRSGRNDFLRLTAAHLRLVGISLAAAILLAVPLGILAFRRPRLGQAVLGSVAILQTVPSLAMFVFMIPLLGIGPAPAIAALFLYSLLPIVRNTHAGLASIDAELMTTARALGLPARARLRRIELPLALPSILAGIKTSAVINVGTATLGALIGAGGYGEPILTGIRLDDMSLILSGAVPAALLALLVQWSFDGIERLVVSPGLRI